MRYFILTMFKILLQIASHTKLEQQEHEQILKPRMAELETLEAKVRF